MLQVDPAPQYRMSAAPLAEATVQVNFPILPRLQTLEGIAPLQEHLSDLLPYMNQQVVQQLEFTIGPAGPAGGSSQAAILHVFTGEDGWTLQVSVGSATLSVDGARYQGVADFLRRLQIIWSGLRDASGVKRCDRLAIRYLDIVKTGDSAWAEWFRPELVGLANPDISGDGLSSSLTEARLVADPTGVLNDLHQQVEGLIRYGVVPAGSLMQGIPPRPISERSFIFDMDISVVATQAFDPNILGDQFLELHAQLEKVFHWAITDSGKNEFQYELVDTEQISEGC